MKLYRYEVWVTIEANSPEDAGKEMDHAMGGLPAGYDVEWDENPTAIRTVTIADNLRTIGNRRAG